MNEQGEPTQLGAEPQDLQTTAGGSTKTTLLGALIGAAAAVPT